ncbi:deoxyribonuclease IV [Bacillus sp. SD088]|uniref:deoxyribonuclease IV n=1 Tax=Bacillus sp. SD088 TaxID=2782012 RepID=UPI001A961C84|nr:deoxyribonuclease IV [Bacillus sp. SD088]MBO0992916.1 deoxyribonuclease IV [Bacillus sp. SD088]
MKFGCHLSIKQGYIGAAKQAVAMNAAAFQYFPKNPRSLGIKNFSKEDTELCKIFCKENGLISVSHSPYPSHLVPHSQQKRQNVIASLLNDLEIADACGSVGVVVHFGKPLNRADPLKSYQLMIEMLDDILQQWDGEAKLLIENNASVPESMGTTLEELVQVRTLSQYPEKIGFCLDTCHAFASGLWTGKNWQEMLDKGLAIGYFEELEVIHLNNSKYPTRLGKDRHAPIFGGGFIKEEQFEQLIKTPQLQDIPFILETPKEECPHEQEIQQLQEKWGDVE